MRWAATARRGMPAALACASAVLLLPAAAPARGTATAARPASVAAAALDLHPCAGVPGVLCGAARVPLYWTNPAGPKLTVRFRIYQHTNTTLAPLEPIVGMEGGPGLASIGSAATYLFMLGPLHARHDLIVMDNRGTGASGAIDCPGLQSYDGLAGPTGPAAVPRLVAACAHQLGPAANAYGTDAVGDDLAFILGRLGVHRVDVYGDSYGDYSAQVFTLHHPGLVRALVLDGSYDNGYNPFEPEDLRALRAAWTRLCARSAGCGGQPVLAEMSALTERLLRHPLRGVALDADGHREQVDLTAVAFAQLVYDATYIYTPFIDLPAAMRAYAAGDAAPLLRLAAEDVAENGSGSPSSDSIGDLEAVSCHDYPTAWKKSASPAARRAELAAAIARFSPHAFYPFPNTVWLASFDENELVYGCLDWRPPAIPDPPFGAGVKYPDTPVLILDGEFDQATPVFDAKLVVRAWPRDTFVEVRNTNHVSGEGDMQQCTSVIIQRFIRTLSAGDTSCAGEMPPISVVPAFPARLSDAPAARPSPGNRATRIGLQAAWVAAQTVGDALARWLNVMVGDTGHGLYGGRFMVTGAYDSLGPLRVTFQGARFVPDVGVFGRAVWVRASGVVTARLRVAGPHRLGGSVLVRWSTAISGEPSVATVRGEVAGEQVSATLAAPWMPQS